MIRTNKLAIGLFMYVICCAFMQTRLKKYDCQDVKNGQFYYYSKTSGINYVIIRKDTLQREINTSSGDTSYWRIKWLSNCIYSAKYISGGGINSQSYLEFLSKHKTIVEIQTVSENYYTVLLRLDSITYKPAMNDTIWLKKKIGVSF